MMDIKKLEQIKDALIISTIKTFEDMAFMEVIQLKEYSENIDYKIISSINIIEPLRGTIILKASESLIKTIVENIYNKNYEALSTKDINDCIEELLNILTGNFLIELYGFKHSYKIELPEIIVNENISINNKVEMYFNAEDNFFKLIYSGEE